MSKSAQRTNPLWAYPDGQKCLKDWKIKKLGETIKFPSTFDFSVSEIKKLIPCEMLNLFEVRPYKFVKPKYNIPIISLKQKWINSTKDYENHEEDMMNSYIEKAMELYSCNVKVAMKKYVQSKIEMLIFPNQYSDFLSVENKLRCSKVY
jgi:hypothetical protein